MPAAGPADLASLALLEQQLAAMLVQAADEIAHTECLDAEQRAEVYTIVESLRHDTASHHAAAELLIRQLARSDADA